MAPGFEGSRARVASGLMARKNFNRGGKRPFRGKQRKVPILNIDSDREARQHWREGKRPDGSYDLPSGFHPATNIGSYESFKFVEAASNTHITLRKRTSQTDSNVWVAEIWGAPERVKQAIDAIYEYVINSNGRGEKKFANVGGELGIRGGPKYEEELHKRLVREQKRSKFCQNHSEEQLAAKRYSHSLVVPWSEANWRVEDALGRNLEALDEVRMDSQCYIHLSRQGGHSNFILLGNKHDKMLEAAERIQQIPARVISHSLPPTQLFLFKPVGLPFNYNAFQIEQKDYLRPARLHALGDKSTGDLAGRFLKLLPKQTDTTLYLGDQFAEIISLDQLEELGAIWLGVRYADVLNAQYLSLWVTEALKQLAVYKGHIEMDLTIGICIFQKYKAQTDLSLADVEDILLDANGGNDLEAFLADDLGHHQGRTLLERLIECRPELNYYDQPLPKSWSFQQCLEQLAPRMKSTFVIEQGPNDHLRLEQDFKFNTEHEWDEISRRWLRVRDNTTEAEAFLSVNMLDLENPYASYGLRIKRCDIVTGLRENKLRPVYHQFADKVEPLPLNPKIISKGKSLFSVPVINNASQVKLLEHEETRIWLFSVGNTGYFVDLYLKATIDITSAVPANANGQQKLQPRQEHWGLRIWHETWPGLFKDNRELGIGKKASWVPKEAQFFPSEGYLDYAEMEGTEAEVGVGFEELLRVMRTVERIAMGTKDQPDSSSRMAAAMAVSTDQGLDSSMPLDTMTDLLLPLLPDVVNETNLADAIFPTEFDEAKSDESFDRVAPGIKKKRLDTAPAKRNANIATVDKATSSADVRAADDRSFTNIEKRLYEQSARKQKSSNNSGPAKRKAKRKAKAKVKAEAQNISTSSAKVVHCAADAVWPRPDRSRNRLPQDTSTLSMAGARSGDAGFWSQQDGPKGPLPKLSSVAGSTALDVPLAYPVMQTGSKSWANVAKVGGNIVDEFPALSSKKSNA